MSPPDELVREILSKLRSSKSAVRLSCVCKSWRDLITKDPDFGDQLFNHIHNCRIKNEDPFMIFYKRPHTDYYQIRTRDSHKFDHINFPCDSCLQMVGSSNGLFCFREWTGCSEFHVHLYNPITREHRKLPPSTIPNRFLYGFGFDTSSNDYKVISIPETNNVIEIYELSTNCWSKRYIEFELGYIIKNLSLDCVYLNGGCCWRLYLGSRGMILTFDFGTQIFRLVSLPREGQGVMNMLGVLDNKLTISLKSSCFLIDRTEVWIRSEHDNNMSSWTKKFSMHVGFGVFCVSRAFDNKLVRRISNGELITLATKEKGKDSNAPGTGMFVVEFPYHPFMVFQPSLVSLRSGSFVPASKC